MTRKLRLEFPGACYHVINRGNYRANIFKTGGAKAAFERCLFEACGKSGWLLHAYLYVKRHHEGEEDDLYLRNPAMRQEINDKVRARFEPFVKYLLAHSPCCDTMVTVNGNSIPLP